MSSLPISPSTAKLEPSPDDSPLTCPRCKRPFRPGELACAQCGTVFSTEGKTQQINTADVQFEQQKKQAPGDVPDGNEKTITCHIGNNALTLNVSSTLVLGRYSGIEGDPTPDVDLTPYGGEEKGVSRRHVRIQYKNRLLYVFDLGSSNGTWLNGHSLVSNSGRPLRDGDELRLGRLKMQISF